MKSIWLFCVYFFHQYIYPLFNDIYTILKVISIAIIGGFVDYLLQKNNSNEKFNFKKAFIHCFIAGYAGYLSQKICAGFNINENLTGFLIGISGFAGTRMLSFFENLSKNIFKKINELQIEVKFGKEIKRNENEN
jgi:ABC-type Co2+ transport system permease subunit